MYCMDNITLDLKEIDFELDREQGRALVNTAVRFRGSITGTEFLDQLGD